MALLILTFAIATPLFSRITESARLKTDAIQMVSLLRMARQEAISSGQARTVVFYPNNAKYKIGSTSYYLKTGIVFVGTTTFTMRVGGMPACGFSPSGAPSSGGTVTLQNSKNRLYIIVNPVAGRIRISESPPENW